jgi:hypothetical protein
LPRDHDIRRWRARCLGADRPEKVDLDGPAGIALDGHAVYIADIGGRLSAGCTGRIRLRLPIAPIE